MRIQMFLLLSEDPENHPMQAGHLVLFLTTSLVAAQTNQAIISSQKDPAGVSLHTPTLLCV